MLENINRNEERKVQMNTFPNLIPQVILIINRTSTETKECGIIESIQVTAQDTAIVIYHTSKTNVSRTACIKLHTLWGEGFIKWDLIN